MKILLITALNFPIGFILVSINYRKSVISFVFFSFFLAPLLTTIAQHTWDCKVSLYSIIVEIWRYSCPNVNIYIYSVWVQLGFMTYAVNWEKKPCITRINFIPLWLFVMFLTYFLGHFVWKYSVHIVFFI